MANNFHSDLDKFNPRELHLRQKLLSREIKQPLDSRAIEISTFDVSADFLALGFSCIGITLTLDNTGIHRNGMPGRIPNAKAAKELERKLNELIKEINEQASDIRYLKRRIEELELKLELCKRSGD